MIKQYILVKSAGLVGGPLSQSCQSYITYHLVSTTWKESLCHFRFIRWSKNIIWSCHQLSILDRSHKVLWFRKLGRKASVTVCWWDHVLIMSPTFDFGPLSQSSDYFCHCPLVRQEVVAAARHISILWETESYKSGCLSYLFSCFIQTDELQMKPKSNRYLILQMVLTTSSPGRALIVLTPEMSVRNRFGFDLI